MSNHIPDNLTLTQAAAIVRSGEISAEDLTRHCLKAVEHSATRLNCFIHIAADSAVEKARALDLDLSRGRVHLSLIHI